MRSSPAQAGLQDNMLGNSVDADSREAAVRAAAPHGQLQSALTAQDPTSYSCWAARAHTDSPEFRAQHSYSRQTALLLEFELSVCYTSIF